MPKRKPFEELTIQDDFMFYKVMQNLRICRKVLQLVLEEDIKIKNIKSQQTIENISESKSIRLDILVEDHNRNSFDVEMQLVENDNIAKRMRIYQASIDISKLIKGKKYKDVTDTIIIFFCMFDPIGKGLPIYVFENFCRKDKDIPLSDGTLKVIVNVKAYEKVDNRELRALLKYIYDGSITTALTKEIDMTLKKIKQNKNILEEYISMYTKMQDEREEGRKEGIINTAKNLITMNIPIENIAKATGLTQEEIAKLKN